jgi:hypothetical protein
LKLCDPAICGDSDWECETTKDGERKAILWLSFGVITSTKLDVYSVQAEITDDNREEGTNAYGLGQSWIAAM